MTDFVEVPVVDDSNLTIRVAIPKPLRVFDGSIPPPKHGIFRIINHKDGDKRVVWDSNSLADIRAAKEMFDDLKKKGLTPFKVGIAGKALSDEMKEFDPMEEQVIFAPIKMARGG
jgi:hypothetical protein